MKWSFTKTLMLAGMLVLAGGLQAQTPYTLAVPKVAAGSITIDGQLTESSWNATSGTLTFGLGGRDAGFDNELDYTIWGDLQYAHNPQNVIKLRHDGEGKLYVAFKSNDADIQGGNGSSMNWWDFQDADGVGSFVVRKKDGSGYHGTTLTFFPPATNPQETGVTPGLAGTYHYGQTRGTTWDWSFLPGTNTVNKIDDEDTGFIIEFVIDLTQSGYTAADNDIQVGIMTANHDGPNTDPYPWAASAFSRFQWSTGSYDVNYGVDHLILSTQMAGGGTQTPSAAKQWTLY
jgi:hypothetical protein